MILADKIINLRKKNGWSQEELAEKLGVTRQSISKYEGAQSIPDLDKILKLSEIFGVTTDYLIKDELEEEEYAPSQMQENESESDRSVHKVTMEMANEYLQIIDWSAGKTAFATMLCILSPIVLLKGRHRDCLWSKRHGEGKKRCLSQSVCDSACHRNYMLHMLCDSFIWNTCGI